MAQIDHPAQLNDQDLRCPHCAKRISVETTTCPTCGYEFLPHRTRITCKRCGSRIPADVEKCPRCGGNPQTDRIPTIVVRLVLALGSILLLVCVGWIIFRVVTTNVLGSHQPTAVPTQVVQVIYVIATPVPLTFTPAPSPTASQMIPLTPTRRGAKPAPTPTPAPPPIPLGYYPSVTLDAPANTTVFKGAGAAIVLAWQSVAPSGLKENEWYEIQINFAGRDNKPAERKSYTKEVRWILSPDLYGEISTDARSVKWTINVVRVDGFDPLASLNRTPVTVGGAARTFIWNP